MNFNKIKQMPWKWYHIVVFCLPGGMFLVTALVTLELRKNGV